MLTSRFEKALLYCCEKHRNQVRKNSRAPFVSHPLAVASLVAEVSDDEDLIIAALLHDCAEDCGGQSILDEIGEIFGSRVRSIVDYCSDSLPDCNHPRPPWSERKNFYFERIGSAPLDAKLISCADKLHNLRSIYGDYLTYGESIWHAFSADRFDMFDNYRRLLIMYRASQLPRRLTDEMEIALHYLKLAIQRSSN